LHSPTRDDKRACMPAAPKLTASPWPFLLRASLLSCTGYFTAMAAAHFTSFKVPVLFIYYDTPFYAYQDKIISFCALAFAIFFHTASFNRATVPAAIATMAVVVAGLSAVNVSAELAEVLDGRPTTMYWLQTAMIAGLTAWLAVCYAKSA
jgi:hypothetical protein